MERKRFDECKEMLQIIPATCVLTSRVRTLVCINGVLSVPSIALAVTTQVPPTDLKPGIDSFIIDTGSGHHLVRRSMIKSDKDLTYCKQGLLLQTANGTVRTNLKTRITVKHLNIKVDAWVLDDTPLVLSTSKLVDENGFDFNWLRASRTASLKTCGRITPLVIQRGVPLLAIK